MDRIKLFNSICIGFFLSSGILIVMRGKIRSLVISTSCKINDLMKLAFFSGISVSPRKYLLNCEYVILRFLFSYVCFIMDRYSARDDLYPSNIKRKPNKSCNSLALIRMGYNAQGFKMLREHPFSPPSMYKALNSNK